MLRDRDPSYAQGYHVSLPLTADAFTAWARERAIVCPLSGASA
jgi:EAL domain-containing protein (putative c-di-GMP-specific phosphodiesterase class I)